MRLAGLFGWLVSRKTKAFVTTLDHFEKRLDELHEKIIEAQQEAAEAISSDSNHVVIGSEHREYEASLDQVNAFLESRKAA